MTRTPDDALARLSERPEIAEDVALVAAEVERLRDALGEVLRRMTERGSIGGVDSHLRTTWFSVAEVDSLRAALAPTSEAPDAR